jgi:hypothetical protein
VDFALNPATRDLDIVAGNVRLLTGREAIQQHLQIRLGLARGEWYQDIRVGVPLYERVLVSGDDIPTVLGVYRKVIATTPGVRSITRLDHTFDAGTRELRIDGEAITVDDEVVVFGHKEFIG